MSLPYGRSLIDQHGEWCAWCLRYIRPEDRPGATYAEGHGPRHCHHMIPVSWIRSRLSKLWVDFRWVVPVHAGCHGLIQADGESSSSYLDDLLAGANSIEERSRISRWFHDRGFYWISALVNLHTLIDSAIEKDAEAQQERIQYILSSAAGIRGAQNLESLLTSSDRVTNHPGIALALANLKVAKGHRRCAYYWNDLAIHVLDGASRVIRERYYPAKLRRQAQVLRDLGMSRDAVAAAESLYSETTGLVIQGILAVSNPRATVVEGPIQLLQERAEDISWLYLSELWFLQALHLITCNSSDLAQIYGLLSRAQYVYVLLGLQMSMSPEIEMHPPPWRKGWDWTPGDVLGSHFTRGPGKGRLDPRECQDLRELYIRDGIRVYADISETMRKWKGAPKPQEGYHGRRGTITSGDTLERFIV